MVVAVDMSPAVQAALAAKQPVVALESTVYSTLGLPPPHNRATLEASLAAVSAQGAVPAITAVIDGTPKVGVNDVDVILSARAKVGAHDLAVAMGQRWPVGVTTVGASLALAHQVGIATFATGGIGGVHRGAAVTGDISGDLAVIARYPIVTVCSGAKSFLDLGRTFELLETLGVTVIGFGTDELPAFTSVSSGIEAPHRCDEVAEVAQILSHRNRLGLGGVLLAVPPPNPIDASLLDDATAEASARADQANLHGPTRTPFMLGAIAELTDGASVEANTALVENNARVAAQIAVHLALEPGPE